MIDWWKEEVKWISILPRSAIWKLYLRKACRPKSVGPALIASKAACRSWRKEATSRSTSGTLSGAKWDIRLLNERWYSLLSLPELTTPCTGMANIALIPCLKTLLLHVTVFQENFLVPGSFSAVCCCLCRESRSEEWMMISLLLFIILIVRSSVIYLWSIQLVFYLDRTIERYRNLLLLVTSLKLESRKIHFRWGS